MAGDHPSADTATGTHDNTAQTPHMFMNMRLVPNVRTNSFEYASLYCNRELGHLQLESNFIGIGSTETLLSIEELNHKVF